jgi:hypothetical protein
MIFSIIAQYWSLMNGGRSIMRTWTVQTLATGTAEKEATQWWRRWLQRRTCSTAPMQDIVVLSMVDVAAAWGTYLGTNSGARSENLIEGIMGLAKLAAVAAGGKNSLILLVSDVCCFCGKNSTASGENCNDELL